MCIAPRLGLARRLDVASLVAAAGEIVDRDGLDGLTLAALAQVAGVKPPSLYAHIDNLQSLRRKVAVLGLTELEREIARAGVGKSGRAAIRDVCLAYRRYAATRPGVYAATVIWTSGRDKDVQAAGTALKRTVMQILSPSATTADYAEQIHLLRLMRVSLHGFVSLEAADAFGEPVDVEMTFGRLVESLTEIVLRSSLSSSR